MKTLPYQGTDALTIALAFGNDERCFETEPIQARLSGDDDDRDRVLGQDLEPTMLSACVKAEQHPVRGMTRYEFPDGSGIVVGGGTWGLEIRGKFAQGSADPKDFPELS